MKETARALLLLSTVLVDPDVAPRAVAQDASPGKPTSNPRLNLESLSATREQPLFTPSRTPPVPEPVPAPTPPPVVSVPEPTPPVLQLIGTVLTQSEQTAVLADPLHGIIHRLRAGDAYHGWRLRIVDGRTVEFSRADRRHILRLFDNFGSAPPVPAMGAQEPAEPPLVIQEPKL